MGFATHLGPWLLGTVKNTTGTTAGTIRNMGAAVVTQSATTTVSDTTAVTLFVLPAGAQINNFLVDITTAYAGTTGNTITIQTAAGSSLAVVGGATTTPLAIGRATVTNTGAQVGTLDTVPFVNYATNTTGQLPFAQFYLIPSLQSPNFLGGITTPTGTFSSIVTSPTGSFTYLYMVGTPTSSYTNCGTISGAKGCVPVQVDGKLQQVPYF